MVQHNPVLQSDEVLSGSEEAQYHRPAPLTRYTDNVPGKEPVNFTGERSNWNEDSFYQPYAQNYAAVSTPQQSSSPGYQPMVNEKCAGTQRKKPRYWIWLLVAVALVCVILAAVLGGVFGSRSNDDDDNKQPWLMSRSSDNLEKLPARSRLLFWMLPMLLLRRGKRILLRTRVRTYTVTPCLVRRPTRPRLWPMESRLVRVAPILGSPRTI